MQLLVLVFLVVLHQLLNQQISFCTTFQNLIQHFLKKDFHQGFPFLTDSPKHPHHPLNGQNPLSMTKVFCRCSLKTDTHFLDQILVFVLLKMKEHLRIRALS